MSHKIRKYVHPKRDQLELLVFFVSFSSTFISPCSFVQLHPSSMPATRAQATNERTNERTNTERERNVVVGATADILGFRLRPLLRVSSGRARSDGEGKNRLSTGPRFVESHLANSVNVVRRRRRRRSLPCPTRSLLHRGRATSEQACSLWSRRTNRGTPPRRRFIATTALR